jgi:hypothetical protein
VELLNHVNIIGPQSVLPLDIEPWAVIEKMDWANLCFLYRSVTDAEDWMRSKGKLVSRTLQRAQGEYASYQEICTLYDHSSGNWSGEELRAITTCNGCHAIAPMICTAFLSPGETSDADIQNIIDVRAAVPAYEICFFNGQLHHTFCDPQSAQEYLQSKGMLATLVEYRGGDITNRNVFQAFLRCFEQRGNRWGKATCNFLVNHHNNAIYKSPHPDIPGKSLYKWVHTLPPACITQCEGIEALGVALLKYATAKFVRNGEGKDEWGKTMGKLSSGAMFEANFFE